MKRRVYNKGDLVIGLYTEGDQYQLTPEYSGESYVGYYHVEKGLLYSDPAPILERQPLYPYVFPEDIEVKNYNIIKETTTPKRTPPIFYLPKPTAKDIANGYVHRYVVQRVPDRTITEISKKQYETIGKPEGIDKALHNEIVFRWKITGPSDAIQFANSGKLSYLEYDFPGISNYFNNLLEFSEFSPTWANQY